MLTAIRERATGWIAWTLVILITIPFALWGINSYFEGASKVVVATVNGVDLEQRAYQQALSDHRRSLVQIMGRNVDAEYFSNPAFKLQVLESLIDSNLQAEYLRERGYRVTDEQLVVVATVNGVDLEQRAYQQALSDHRRSLVQIMGRNVDAEYFSNPAFKLQVLESLIDSNLQAEYLRERGYRVTDEQLVSRIRSIEAFHSDGVFDTDRYEALVRNAGLSVEGFEQQQRQREIGRASCRERV